MSRFIQGRQYRLRGFGDGYLAVLSHVDDDGGLWFEAHPDVPYCADAYSIYRGPSRVRRRRRMARKLRRGWP